MINLASFYIIIEISCARRTILTACRCAGAYGTSHGTVAARGEPSPFVTFSLFAPIPLLALKSTLASGSPAAAAFSCAGLSVVPGDASAVLTNRPRLVMPWPKPAPTALDTGALLRLSSLAAPWTYAYNGPSAAVATVKDVCATSLAAGQENCGLRAPLSNSAVRLVAELPGQAHATWATSTGRACRRAAAWSVDQSARGQRLSGHIGVFLRRLNREQKRPEPSACAWAVREAKLRGVNYIKIYNAGLRWHH
jgi:hypothetical protein